MTKFNVKLSQCSKSKEPLIIILDTGLQHCKLNLNDAA
jgi:hypothetical protein